MLNVKHLGISCKSCNITQFVYTKKNTEKDNSQNLNKPLTWQLARGKQQPVQQPFIQDDLGEPIPAKNTYLLTPAFSVIIQHI